MQQMFRMEVIDADMGGERDPRFDAAAFAGAARARTTREKRRPREVAVGDEDAGERGETTVARRARGFESHLEEHAPFTRRATRFSFVSGRRGRGKNHAGVGSRSFTRAVASAA